MKRRRVLGSIGAAGGTLLAGCTASGAGEPVASPALVEISNRTGRTIDVEVEVQKDGTQVHDERYTIERVKTGEETDHGYPAVDGVQIVDDWMTSAAEFEFQFAVPADELTATFSSDDPIGSYEDASQSELEGECYFVQVEIGDGSGNATPETVPERIGARAVVYDHEVFDRSHAGDCG
ncbi:hypothetical protein [Natronorubrum sp. FCH18a]|uniref:hypothetical protein n=1 Tax=Natronorubrum sp. FCH18a TaxID=3447018 RepID=UPI003F5128A3